MEVDQVGFEDWHEDSCGEWREGEEIEVDYVGGTGSGGFHRCGGFGHFARECGTPKGREKETLAKAKVKANIEVEAMAREEAKDGTREDFGWGHTKGDGRKGGKAKGKGFVCECWSCGEKGHRANGFQKTESPMEIKKRGGR